MPANNPTCTGGCNSTTVTPTANTTIKAAPGYLHRVLLATANGANAITIYDSADPASVSNCTILGLIAANAAAGTVYLFDFNAAKGIVIPGVAAAAQITVGYD